MLPIKETENEILAIMYEIQEANVILNDMINNKETQGYYQGSLEYYNKLLNKLRILLEAYFKEEKELGLPAVLTYRKVYRKLKSL